jgi:hypothetical protein
MEEDEEGELMAGMRNYVESADVSWTSDSREVTLATEVHAMLSRHFQGKWKAKETKIAFRAVLGLGDGTKESSNKRVDGSFTLTRIVGYYSEDEEKYLVFKGPADS